VDLSLIGFLGFLAVLCASFGVGFGLPDFGSSGLFLILLRSIESLSFVLPINNNQLSIRLWTITKTSCLTRHFHGNESKDFARRRRRFFSSRRCLNACSQEAAGRATYKLYWQSTIDL
jgi:hypothetical protein